ncbi:putative histone deacetylase domain-containing protein [Erysiphe neolycopersici]|uniref:Putative histone deacetylase domain-containing protein n=1 Tax=Erysiphe neolycopersici TaxID=212602 RepID=A0A420HHK8_9PEZI|nr:putative histone deacetylase domain-containing protein [Erysiphe neolycopersici]
MSSSSDLCVRLLSINEAATESIISSASTNNDAVMETQPILEPTLAISNPEPDSKGLLAQTLPICGHSIVVQSLESTNIDAFAQSPPAHIPRAAIDSSPNSTKSDPLAQLFNRLTLDSSAIHGKIEIPETPLSARLPPKSPFYHSPAGKSSPSRPSLSTIRKRPSFNNLNTPTTPTVRRSSSSNFINASTLVGKPKLASENKTNEPTRNTPESVAQEFLKAELEVHQSLEKFTRSVSTIVILHDSCYGHRYSRPRTSKTALSNIVERPERIHASVLGISAAYIRLGERHSGGRYAPNLEKGSVTNLPTPFRIYKTTRTLALTSNAVTNVHGKKWMTELKIMCDDAESRLAMYGKELVRPEMDRSTDQEVPAKLHEGDLYLCSESLNAMEGALGAVCDGVDAVFRGTSDGKGPCRAFVAIRPPGHHCSASHPSGFCWVNNVHVGVSHASLTYGLTHAAIIDFDLHHGDGSQTIAWETNKRASSAARNALPWKKTSIGYFSLHDINSYPCEMGDDEKVKNASLCIENAHGQSIWNVHLQPWKTEAEFWKLYESKYSVLLEKARNYLRAQTERLRYNGSGIKPTGAIFISAGFDASEWESSGMQRHKVNVPTEFYARFTRDIVRLASEKDTAVEGRIISVLEGGYSDKALCTGVLSHLSGMAAWDPMITDHNISPNENSHVDLPQNMDHPNGNDLNQHVDYNPNWWSFPILEELDRVRNPPKTPDPKVKRDGPTTFSSPTQSFISKVNTPLVRRTTPGKSHTLNQSPRQQTSSTPSSSSSSSSIISPPPQVSWSIAANELSKLLIPTSRETTSCKSENLSGEKMRKKLSRAQKDAHSNNLSLRNIISTNIGEKQVGRMALRTRRPAKGSVVTIKDS